MSVVSDRAKAILKQHPEWTKAQCEREAVRQLNQQPMDREAYLKWRHAYVKAMENLRRRVQFQRNSKPAEMSDGPPTLNQQATMPRA
jgi:hypothetical protein